MKEKIHVLRDYFKLLENFSTERSDFDQVLHPEFRQKEFPNVLNKNGQESDLEDTLRRVSLGQKMLSRQIYEISNHIEHGNQIVIESHWTGWMAVDAGPLKANQEIRAQFCIVCEFKDSKLFRQRNYDCFYPFS